MEVKAGATKIATPPPFLHPSCLAILPRQAGLLGSTTDLLCLCPVVRLLTSVVRWLEVELLACVHSRRGIGLVALSLPACSPCSVCDGRSAQSACAVAASVLLERETVVFTGLLLLGPGWECKPGHPILACNDGCHQARSEFRLCASGGSWVRFAERPQKISTTRL